MKSRLKTAKYRTSEDVCGWGGVGECECVGVLNVLSVLGVILYILGGGGGGVVGCGYT